jgi:hypothetical protein
MGKSRVISLIGLGLGKTKNPSGGGVFCFLAILQRSDIRTNVHYFRDRSGLVFYR